MHRKTSKPNSETEPRALFSLTHFFFSLSHAERFNFTSCIVAAMLPRLWTCRTWFWICSSTLWNARATDVPGNMVIVASEGTNKLAQPSYSHAVFFNLSTGIVADGGSGFPTMTEVSSAQSLATFLT